MENSGPTASGCSPSLPSDRLEAHHDTELRSIQTVPDIEIPFARERRRREGQSLVLWLINRMQGVALGVVSMPVRPCVAVFAQGVMRKPNSTDETFAGRLCCLAFSASTPGSRRSAVPNSWFRQWHCPMSSRQHLLPERPLNRGFWGSRRRGVDSCSQLDFPARRSPPAGTECSLFQAHWQATFSRYRTDDDSRMRCKRSIGCLASASEERSRSLPRRCQVALNFGDLAAGSR